MKKYVFYAAAAVALASCSSDEILETNASLDANENAQTPIMFASNAGKITRANTVGAAAADLLGQKFYVLGTKGELPATTLTDATVFDNYTVEWKANTAGTTSTNTHDWEYVGVTKRPDNTGITSQTIKYWDNSVDQYDFVAYSVGGNALVTGTTAASAGSVNGSLITPAGSPSFTIKAASVADLTKCYYTDVVTVEKGNYGKDVQLVFKNLTAKVRLGMYETVPGYKVSDVEFYQDATTAKTTDISANTAATLFTAAGTTLPAAGEITVSYPVVGSTAKAATPQSAAYNKAQVAVTATGTGGATTIGLGETTASELATSAKEATMYNDGVYTPVMPANAGALTLRVNYTLTSEDGSNETIKVYGATAVVPATYTNWQPNYAYTYIFKISDKTNGWTNPNDTEEEKAGLFPIIFDAVVEATTDADMEHESITTVETPSTTSYAFNATTGEVIKAYGVGNEYPAATTTDIYFMVYDGGQKADLNTKGQLYELSDEKATEALVIDALQIQETSDANSVTGRNSLVLTKVATTTDITEVPTEGGNVAVTKYSVAKFTATTTAKTYAYVYLKDDTKDDTFIYSAVEFAASATKPADFTTAYFKDNKGTVAVADADWDNTNKQLFYKKYTNNNNIYGVKVVKTY